MSELLYLNGDFLPTAEGRISCEDRGFNFADGVYEVIRVYGGQPFTLREHLERQVHSARGLDFEIPLSVEEFEGVCRELIGRSGLQEAFIYTQVSRGVAPRNHLYDSETLEPTVMAFIRTFRPPPSEWRAEGAGALPEPDVRYSLCHLKTIALLPNVLAKNRARRAGCAEALLHLEDGTVTEGSATNAYIVRGGEVWTAPLGPKILPGITRAQLLEIAQEIGIRVHEESFSLREAEQADEVILSASTVELLPITWLGDKTIGSGKPGPVCRQLHEAYHARIKERCGLTERVSP